VNLLLRGFIVVKETYPVLISTVPPQFENPMHPVAEYPATVLTLHS